MVLEETERVWAVDIASYGVEAARESKPDLGEGMTYHLQA